MTYKEYDNAEIYESKIPCYAEYPRKIYVGTGSMGVYYTENFTDPNEQPTWKTVNSGLPNLLCREFFLDPFHQVYRQYVLLSGNFLCKRENEGNWNVILSPDIIRELYNLYPTEYADISGFCADNEIDGKILALIHHPNPLYRGSSWPHNCYTILHSFDYGETWAEYTRLYEGLFTYGLGDIRASGGTMYASTSIYAGGNGTIHYSKEYNWSRCICYLNQPISFRLNYNKLDRVYTVSGLSPQNLAILIQFTCPPTVVQPGIGDFGAYDDMWFHPSNWQYMRYLNYGHLYVTDDEWSTMSNLGYIIGDPYYIARWFGDNTDHICLGLRTTGWGVETYHSIGILIDESSSTPLGIAGSNCMASPFTDSIPYTCGGICRNGIQGVREYGLKYLN
jgi:hypothetical protein